MPYARYALSEPVSAWDLTRPIDAGETLDAVSFSLAPPNDYVEEGDETLSVAGTTAATDLTVAATIIIADDRERGVTTTGVARARGGATAWKRQERGPLRTHFREFEHREKDIL